MIGLLWAKYPRRTNARVAERGFARLLSGVRIARRDPLHLAHPPHAVLVLVLLARVRRPHAGDRGRQPRHRSRRAGSTACSTRASVSGAALGAVSVGTVFARCSKAKLLRPGVPRVRGRARRVRAAARSPRSRIPVVLAARLRVLRRDHRPVDVASNRTSPTKNGGESWRCGSWASAERCRVGVLVGGWVDPRHVDHRGDPGRRGLGGRARRVVECAVVASEGGTGCLSRTRSPTASCGRACARWSRRRRLGARRRGPGHAGVAGARRARAPGRCHRRRRARTDGRPRVRCVDAGAGRRPRRARPPPTCSPSGTSTAPQFEAMLAAAPAEIAGQATLRRRDARARPAQRARRARRARQRRGQLGLGLDRRRAHAQRRRPRSASSWTGEQVSGVGDVVARVEAPRFELFRAVSGRRTAAEIDAVRLGPRPRPAAAPRGRLLLDPRRVDRRVRPAGPSGG